MINSPIIATVFPLQFTLCSSNNHIDQLGIKAVFLIKTKVFATDCHVCVASKRSRGRRNLGRERKSCEVKL